MMVAEGRAERFPLEPAASRSAASPHALPTHSVKMGGFTYLGQRQQRRGKVEGRQREDRRKIEGR